VKKTFGYFATGILLGVAIMLIPLSLFIGQGYPRFALTRDLAPETERKLGVGDVVAFQSSLTYVGLMFVVSLVSALGVYFFFKRRMTT